MRRIKVVLAALAVAIASFAAISGPAIADDLNCRDARGNLIRCNGDLYAPYYNYNYYRPFFNNYYYNPYFYDWDDYYWHNYSSCPFWGDYSGIVNQWDCFD